VSGPEELDSRAREDRYTLATYNHLRFPLRIVSGRGSIVRDDRGDDYLDLYGGHAVCLIGHSHPRWVADMTRQLSELVFYSNTVYYEARGVAAQLLVEHSYPSMHGAYFSCSGADANETALKIARKATGRPLVIAMDKGFHGRTIGALSVTGYPKMREAFPQNTAQWTRFVPFGELDAIEAVPPGEVAAIILEPIQSVAGIFTADSAYYRGLRTHCDRHGICLIFDEVQTGSGRTGRWYFGDHVGVEPDLVTTAKGVGGGMPVGVVLANEKYARTVLPGDQATTFGGGPLAVAAIVSTYRILIEERLVERVAEEAPRLIARLRAIPGVREVRGLGYLLGIQCDRPAKDVQDRLMARRILVGTSSEPSTLRLLPPLTVSRAEWNHFESELRDVLSRP
jgi:acetylornithine/N-succinyldiaminopimelate aminotransferase